jgi:hypothetical protein
MCSAGIILASGFSSSVSSAVGDEVLLQGKNCVIVSFASLPDNVTGADFEALAGYTTQKIQNAASLADQCVEGGAPRALACDFFSTRRLPLEIFDTSAPCPFDEKICVSRDGNLVIDTGLIDSHEHLGINAHPSERFAFRRKIHCAPLTTKGYTEDVVDASGEVTKTRYSYGRQWSSTERANFTYEYINRPANRTPTQTASDYTLG